MKLLDVVQRQPIPEPWAEGEKIPWSEPAFSQRMLQEHLSQEHDAASRRAEIIERQVDWIHHHVLGGNPGQILDLGCGPGLYASRLAKRGHTCLGIDYAPASIAYAQAQAERENLACTYQQQDIRAADYGGGHDLVMLIFGEFNVFRPSEARRILAKAYRALQPGGRLLLEPHTFSAVRQLGEQPPSWYAARGGLFSDRPHLCLSESFWQAEQKVAVQRYFIVDAETGRVTRHGASTQAYTDEEYRSLLTEEGFGQIDFYPSLTGREEKSQSALMVILARNESETWPRS